MGQYYKACFTKENSRTFKSISPYDWKNGAKLMEHSYVGNVYVNALLRLIVENPHHIVWAGDYADNVEGEENNLYDLATPYKREEEYKSYLSKEGKEISEEHRYLCNHTKKVFIDLSKAKADDYGYIIHPLCLLTANGNGRGGGDYRGTNMKEVGSWKGDLVSLERDGKGYKEMEVEFQENR